VQRAGKGLQQMLPASRAPPQGARRANTANALREQHQTQSVFLAPMRQNAAGQTRFQHTRLPEALCTATTVDGMPQQALEEWAPTILPSHVGVMVFSRALQRNPQSRVGADILELWMEIKILVGEATRARTRYNNQHPGGKSIWDKFVKSARSTYGIELTAAQTD